MLVYIYIYINVYVRFPVFKTQVEKYVQIKLKTYVLGGTFKMAEELDVEITFLPTNTSKIHVEQLQQNTY